MADARVIRTESELAALRSTLRATSEKARESLRALVDHPQLLSKLKFERLGCDPLDPSDPQNLAEQIDQQATYEVAVLALEELFRRFPGRDWTFAPGAHGSGHDIESTDGTVAAEVFAAVDPSNNRKLARDVAKVGGFAGPHRFVFFRSPGHGRSSRMTGSVEVVSVGEEVAHGRA